MIKKFRKSSPIAYDPSSNVIGHEETAVREAVAKICPDSCSPPLLTHYPSLNNQSSRTNSCNLLYCVKDSLRWLDSPFTIREIHAALDSIKISSSSGLDCIEYQLLKMLPDILLSCLLTILNQLFQSSIFPRNNGLTL